MRVNNFSDVMAKADNISDFIPVVSTVSNLVDIFHKCIVVKIAGTGICKNRYFSHLNKKSFARCVLLLVPILGNIIIGIYERLRHDKQYMLAAVKEDSLIFDLSNACKKLRGDKDVVLAAVKKDGSALYYASEALKDDKEVVLAAIHCYIPAKGWYCEERFGWVVNNASKRLRADKEVMLAAIKNNDFTDVFKYATEDLRDDKDFVLEAIQSDYTVLSHVSQRLRGDRDVIFAAVKKDYRALKHASDELGIDREIVLTAFRHFSQSNDWDTGITEYLTAELRADKEFMLEAVKYHRPALKCVSDELKQDNEFMAAVTAAAEAGETHRRDLRQAAMERSIHYRAFNWDEYK